MAKLALALPRPAGAFVAPGQQAASKVVVKGDIGVDPGPIDPPARSGMTRRGSPAASPSRSSTHLHDGVPRHDGPGAGHHLPGLHQPRWLGAAPGHPQGRHGLPGGRQHPDAASSRSSRSPASPRSAPCPRPSTRAARRTSRAATRLRGTIPGGYPFTTQTGRHGAQPRPHVRAPERPRGHARHVRRHVPTRVDSCDHHFFYPITPTSGSTRDSELCLAFTDARPCDLICMYPRPVVFSARARLVRGSSTFERTTSPRRRGEREAP